MKDTIRDLVGEYRVTSTWLALVVLLQIVAILLEVLA